MKNFLKKLSALFATWLFKPKAKTTYTCCSDKDEDEKKSGKGGFAY